MPCSGGQPSRSGTQILQIGSLKRGDDGVRLDLDQFPAATASGPAARGVSAVGDRGDDAATQRGVAVVPIAGGRPNVARARGTVRRALPARRDRTEGPLHPGPHTTPRGCRACRTSHSFGRRRSRTGRILLCDSLPYTEYRSSRSACRCPSTSVCRFRPAGVPPSPPPSAVRIKPLAAGHAVSRRQHATASCPSRC